MHVFAYEFVTGGGWYSAGDSQQPPESLAVEGWAMLEALLTDLAAIPAVTVSSTLDARAGDLAAGGCAINKVASDAEERAVFGQLAAQADWTIVIAPEFQRLLATRNLWVQEAGGRLLGAPAMLVELASDKHHMAEYLSRRGVPTPPGRAIEPFAALPADCRFPAVVKPLDGAGSLDVRLIETQSDLPGPVATGRRLEQFCAGLAASISCLCGPRQNVILPACEQILKSDGSFGYLGGRLPLVAGLDRRARSLAERVLDCLPDALGYLGIDLVLGNDPSGSEDYVIEINPRFTTSYLGLRALAQDNLAAALLAVAAGCPTALSFGDRRVQFAANGRLLWPAEPTLRDVYR